MGCPQFHSISLQMAELIFTWLHFEQSTLKLFKVCLKLVRQMIKMFMKFFSAGIIFFLTCMLVRRTVSAHDKTYNKTCATREDSDQPAHPHSLIRVFTDHICLLQLPGYPKRDKQEPLQFWVMYMIICVFASYIGLIVGFVMRWLIFKIFSKRSSVRVVRASILGS